MISVGHPSLSALLLNMNAVFMGHRWILDQSVVSRMHSIRLYQAQAVCRHLYCHLLAVCNLWGLGFVWVMASASDVAMPDLQNICKWQVQFWHVLKQRSISNISSFQVDLHGDMTILLRRSTSLTSRQRVSAADHWEAPGKRLQRSAAQPLGVFDGFLCFFGQRPNALQLPFLRKAQIHEKATCTGGETNKHADFHCED